MKSRTNVVIFETPEEVAEAAAERFAEYAALSIKERGAFAVALAGGTTPRRAYELLAGGPFQQRIDWPHVHLFFGDERMVPPDSRQSNYRMIHDALVSKVPIPNDNIHRIRGELAPEESARSYESELRNYFGEVDWPRFDLVWLGMGADGHIASLFPGTKNAEDATGWVVKTINPDTSQERVSLTLPVINHAPRINFLVTGNEKAATLSRVLGDVQDKNLPAQKIAPVAGVVEWLIDRAAASLL